MATPAPPRPTPTPESQTAYDSQRVGSRLKLLPRHPSPSGAIPIGVSVRSRVGDAPDCRRWEPAKLGLLDSLLHDPARTATVRYRDDAGRLPDGHSPVAHS